MDTYIYHNPKNFELKYCMLTTFPIHLLLASLNCFSQIKLGLPFINADSFQNCFNILFLCIRVGCHFIELGMLRNLDLTRFYEKRKTKNKQFHKRLVKIVHECIRGVICYNPVSPYFDNFQGLIN